MSQHVPALESAYRMHRGLLFSALGKLAREGYATPPTESLDLIHDFFLEAWDGLAERYDPERASLTTYLYAAFVRFARPRIAKVQRLRATLIDPHELGDAIAERWAVDDASEAVDLRRVHAALAVLPSDDRKLLNAWLASGYNSERNVARMLGLSRYGARQRLIEALGRVVTSVGALSDLPPVDRFVAQATWGEQLSVMETAARHGLTLQAVRNAYRRNQHRMQKALSLVQRAGAHSLGSSSMPPLAPAYFKSLIDRVHKQPHDNEVLSEITRHALELVKFLESTDEPDALRSWETLDASWLSDVYSALSIGLGENERGDEVDPALFEADMSDRRQVGQAFKEALVPAIPQGIDGLIEEIRPHVVAKYRNNPLLDEPDVQAGGEDAQRLAAFGMTPVHLVLASDAVSLLIARAKHAGYFSDPVFSFDRRQGRVRHITNANENRLDREVLVQEIADMTTLGTSLADPLLDWLVDVAPRVTELFIGFSATDSLDAVALTPCAADVGRRNLLQRWRSVLVHSPKWTVVANNDIMHDGLPGFAS